MKNLPKTNKSGDQGWKSFPAHNALKRNLMKVWKTWTGPLLGGRAWSRGLKSALSKILQNKEHFH